MTEAKYIVIRKSSLATKKVGRLSGRVGTQKLKAQYEGTDLTDPQLIKIETLNDREAAELHRDPNVLASSRSIPISLVRPLTAEASEGIKAEQDAKATGASWGVQEIAPKADRHAGAGVTVAVLDTGIDPDHPAFKSIAALHQKNFSNSPNDNDLNGHGTHCAGTIFGRNVEGIRIGVARGVRSILIGKILDDEGHGESDSIVQAIQWAQANGAQVISMSVGIDFTQLVSWLEQQGMARTEALSRALAAYRDTVRVFDSLVQLLNVRGALLQSGAVTVSAAGNESARNARKPYVVDVGVPAAAIEMISVGALGRGANGYEIAHFSNINPQVCAPGVGIVSAGRGGSLVSMSGTSMATPHVAGVAVLWWERLLQDNPKASGELVQAKLIASCLSSGFAPGVTFTDRGAGCVQAPN
jgi:subtilisin family serine protease